MGRHIDKSQYIENLVKYLINKNNYIELFHRVQIGFDEFIGHVKWDLYAGEVKKMNPKTLGQIMCSFQPGEIRVDKDELFEKISFSGDCEDMLRELVSLCLACVIMDHIGCR